MNFAVQEVMRQVVSAQKNVQIKLLGDSITHGVGGSGFAQDGAPIVAGFARNPSGYCWANRFKRYMEQQYSCTVTNNACTGTNIQFVIEHLEQLVEPKDDIVICTIGTNNRHCYFAQGAKPDRTEFYRAFQENIIRLHEKLCAMGKRVIFVANIPATLEREQDGEDFWRILHMNDIRDAYAQASVKCGFPLVSLYDRFLQACKTRGIEDTTLYADGLHPNDAGYDLMLELLLDEFGV